MPKTTSSADNTTEPANDTADQRFANRPTFPVPLSRLRHSDYNMRSSGVATANTELMASLLGHGQLQPLLAYRGTTKAGKPTGYYLVADGGRRLNAFNSLAASKALPSDHPIEIKEITEDEAAELSLAGNSSIPPEPVERFLALKNLTDKGMTIGEISARFGVTERAINGALKIASLAPRFLAMLREKADGMNYEIAKALSLSDSHEEQEEVWDSTPPYSRNANYIKQRLTTKLVTPTDRRVLLIGLDTYLNAGGATRSDLFSDVTYLEDSTLVDQLVLDKMQEAARHIRMVGWKWVEISLPGAAIDLAGFTRIYPDTREPTEAEAAESQQLENELEDISAQLETCSEDEEPTLIARQEALSARFEAIENSLSRYSAEQMSQSGVVISLTSWGPTLIREELGCVRPEDRNAISGQPATSTKGAPFAENVTEDESKPLSAALGASLTAERTQAIAIEVATQPTNALIILAHALAMQTLWPFSFSSDKSICDIRLTIPNLKTHCGAIEETPAGRAWSAMLDKWRKTIGSRENLWPWLVKSPQDQILELIAVCAASSIDTTQLSGAARPGAATTRVSHHLGMNMAKWWTPTSDNYLSRVPKTAILAAITEACGAETARGLADLKKAALVIRAEELLAGKNWLPELLRLNALETDASVETCEGTAESCEIPETEQVSDTLEPGAVETDDAATDNPGIDIAAE